MFQRLLGRFCVRICSSGSPSSLHTYGESKKVKTLPACIHNASLFLIQREAKFFENQFYPLQYPVGVASA